ncbi:hypothetical protein CAMSH0001_2272 [Campylobacter showae RM3277]|uniref:Uncharacterized protein n=1 Tax=Campylobacter showae RM3277 TaxID=553219 RepID=C6RG10_9BACT|nr:hypothetical protein CAMSH0001_2272 [Campylobacter showae RM3277]
MQAALSGSERSEAKVELCWLFKFWPSQICRFSPVANLKYIARRRHAEPVLKSICFCVLALFY